MCVKANVADQADRIGQIALGPGRGADLVEIGS